MWVFSGQGSQWAQMGAELLANEPVFAATVAAAEPLIARESGFSVTEAMTASQVVTGIDRIRARSSVIPSVRPRQPSSPEPFRSKTGCASFAGARG